MGSSMPRVARAKRVSVRRDVPQAQPQRSFKDVLRKPLTVDEKRQVDDHIHRQCLLIQEGWTERERINRGAEARRKVAVMRLTWLGR